MIKYACISGYILPVKDMVEPRYCMSEKEACRYPISAHGLPALYGVPEYECTFILNSHALKSISPNLIYLTPRPKGDYKVHLKILKAHHLLEK